MDALRTPDRTIAHCLESLVERAFDLINRRQEAFGDNSVLDRQRLTVQESDPPQAYHLTVSPNLEDIRLILGRSRNSPDNPDGFRSASASRSLIAEASKNIVLGLNYAVSGGPGSLSPGKQPFGDEFLNKIGRAHV